MTTERTPDDRVGAGAAPAGGETGLTDSSFGAAGRELASGLLGSLFFWWSVAVAVFHLLANGLGTTLSRLLAPLADAGLPVAGLAAFLADLSTLSTLTLTGLHFAGFAILAAIRYPLVTLKGAGARRAVLAFDVLFGVLVAVATLGLVASENAIYDRGVTLTPLEWAMGAVAILGAIELTRRTTGWIIPILIVLALTYPTIWGDDISGVFRFAGLSAETVLFRSIYSDEGMFGFIGRISATFVFMFILFGAFLIRSGAGDFIVDLARALAGRLTGGPGFVAVFASGLTGTTNGSAIANTVSTGSITIPLMVRSGFPPRFAAGVEAAASTGGQLMPPIMGAGAFVMASYTQIPYLDIVAVAFLPALVYFLSVGLFVRIEARRSNVGADGEVPPIWGVLRRGGPAFLIPVAVLVGLLVYGLTPTFAAGFAIISVVLASWLTPNRMGWRAILEALALGARNMITTAVLLIAVGLVVNVIAMTGIGNTFSLMISDWAGGNLLVAIVLIALASLVLGMGLPVTAAYIVLATLSAPALQELILAQAMSPADIDADVIAAMVNGTVSEAIRPFFLLADPAALVALAGPMPLEEARALYASLPAEVVAQIHDQARAALDPAIAVGALLSAHMIIFWLSQDSNVTPPVCLTAFAAAAIARTPPMATGLTSWKLAKGLYLMPVLFAYTPFLTGTTDQVFVVFLIALLGVSAFGVALEGYLEAPVSVPVRIVLSIAGLVLLWPNTPVISAAGAVVVLAIFALNVRTGQRSRRAAVTT